MIPLSRLHRIAGLGLLHSLAGSAYLVTVFVEQFFQLRTQRFHPELAPGYPKIALSRHVVFFFIAENPVDLLEHIDGDYEPAFFQRLLPVPTQPGRKSDAAEHRVVRPGL